MCNAICNSVCRYCSQRLSASGFVRQQTHSQESCEEQTCRCVDRRLWIRMSSIDRDKGSTETSKAVQEAGDTSSSTSVWSREHFRRVSVQDAVHDILEESFQTGHGQLVARARCLCEEDQEYSRNNCRASHGKLATDVFDTDQPASKNTSRHTDDRSDCVVSVRVVLRGLARVPSRCKVLRQERVEQWVAPAIDSQQTL